MFFYHLNEDGEPHHLYLRLHLKDSLCIDIQNSKLGRRWFESNGVSYGRVALWHSWVGWDVEWNFEQMVLLAPPTTSNHPQAQPRPPPAVQLHCRPAAYFTPTTTKSDILHLLTDSILHCCANFTFYRFNSRQSLSSLRHPFHWKFLEILGLNFTFNYSHLSQRYATSQFGRVLSNSKLCAVT